MLDHHLRASLTIYLNISAQTSQLLTNQSASVKSLSTHVSNLNDMINHNFRGLESGFERVSDMLERTEERMSLYTKDYRTWMIATVGFVVGAASRLLNLWILIGTPLLLNVEGRLRCHDHRFTDSGSVSGLWTSTGYVFLCGHCYRSINLLLPQ